MELYSFPSWCSSASILVASLFTRSSGPRHFSKSLWIGANVLTSYQMIEHAIFWRKAALNHLERRWLPFPCGFLWIACIFFFFEHLTFNFMFLLLLAKYFLIAFPSLPSRSQFTYNFLCKVNGNCILETMVEATEQHMKSAESIWGCYWYLCVCSFPPLSVFAKAHLMQ